jgi:hypothetical protein
VDTTAKGNYLTIIDFSADSKGFCLVEQRIDKLTRISDYKYVSGSVQVIDTDSTRYGRAKRVGYVWVSFQATDANNFVYVHSTTGRNKRAKYLEGTVRNCVVELPYDKAKSFLWNVW